MLLLSLLLAADLHIVIQGGKSGAGRDEITIGSDGTPARDGIYRVWVDGVLVHEQSDVLIRKYPHAQVQDLPFVNIYHGGMGRPKGPERLDMEASDTAISLVPARGTRDRRL